MREERIRSEWTFTKEDRAEIKSQQRSILSNTRNAMRHTHTHTHVCVCYVSGKTTLWMQVAVNQLTERKIHCEISSRIRVMCKHVLCSVSWFPLQKLVFHFLLLLCASAADDDDDFFSSYFVRSFCVLCFVFSLCVCVIDGIPFIRVIRLV